MDDPSIGALLVAVILLVFVSAYFSDSETAMMALNRYRLKHLADGPGGRQPSGHTPAHPITPSRRPGHRHLRLTPATMDLKAAVVVFWLMPTP